MLYRGGFDAISLDIIYISFEKLGVYPFSNIFFSVTTLT